MPATCQRHSSLGGDLANSEGTLVDRWWRGFKNHPVGATVVIVVAVLTGALALWNGLPPELRTALLSPLGHHERAVDGWVFVGTMRDAPSWKEGPFVVRSATVQTNTNSDNDEPFRYGDVVEAREALRVVVADGGRNVFIPPPLLSPVVREEDYTGQILKPGTKWVVLNTYRSGYAVWLRLVSLGWAEPPPLAPRSLGTRLMLLSLGSLLVVGSVVLAGYLQLRRSRDGRALRIVLDGRRSFVHVGSMDDAPALHIATTWIVTNTGDRPLQLIDAKLKSPRFKGKVTSAVLSGSPRGINFHNTFFEVGPGETYDVAVHLVGQPAPKKPEAIKVRFGFVDQFAHLHLTPAVVLRSG